MVEGILVRSSGTHHPHHTPIGNCTAQVPDIFGQSVEQNKQSHEVPISSTIKSLVTLTTWPFTNIAEDVLKTHSSQQYCINPKFPRHWVPNTSFIFHICCGASRHPTPCLNLSGIDLCMCRANERRLYNVTPFLIGWAHAQMIPDQCQVPLTCPCKFQILMINCPKHCSYSVKYIQSC